MKRGRFASSTPIDLFLAITSKRHSLETLPGFLDDRCIQLRASSTGPGSNSISMRVVNQPSAGRLAADLRERMLSRTRVKASQQARGDADANADHCCRPAVRTPQVIVAWTEVKHAWTAMGFDFDQLVLSDNRLLQTANPTTRQRLRDRPEARRSSFVTVVTTAVSPASRESRWTPRYESANVESV